MASGKSDLEREGIKLFFWIILLLGIIVTIAVFLGYAEKISSIPAGIIGLFLVGMIYYLQDEYKKHLNKKKCCPFCAEKIIKAAIICKYCKKEFRE
jgi:hypothetical protein